MASDPIEDKCSVVGGNICTDGVRALIYGTQQMASFNKTMSLLDAHTALAPFSRVRPQSACSRPAHTRMICLSWIYRHCSYFFVTYDPGGGMIHATLLQYSSDGGHEAVEDLLLLLSLTFEDYALSLEPGVEPTQGAVAFLVTMVAGLPVTMLRLTALIGPQNATAMNHTDSQLVV